MTKNIVQDAGLVVLVVWVVRGVGGGPDPAACQRAIKFMLIKACGEAKRHVFTMGMAPYPVLTAVQVDERYDEMVHANMIKGVKRDTMSLFDDNSITDKPNQLFFYRKKRSFMDNRERFITDPIHKKQGTHYYELPDTRDDRSPPPGALKAKCCGGYLCSMDDFRGFCV